MIKEYTSKGYIKIEKFLNDNQVEDIKKKIYQKEPTLFVPFSDEAWGFGNLLGDTNFSIIYQAKQLKEIVEKIANCEIEYNHLMANRKPAWIGPEVEYHQEIFNSGTFAAGVSREEIKKKWVQIYIPLENETPDNGGLRILENSHELYELPYEDFVNQNFSHKRRVPAFKLDEITKTGNCFVRDLLLKKGDCLIFSPLLIHGSPSNGSSQERTSLVMQARPKNFNPDKNIFENETSIRNDFIIDSMSSIVTKLRSKNRYTDFKANK